MDAKQIVITFAESMTGLMEILIKENEAIKAHKYSDIGPLQSRKVQLAKGFDEAQRQIEANLEILDVLDQEERSDLRKLYKRFRDTLATNMLSLRGAHDATDRIIKLIIDAVKEQRGVKTAPAAFCRRGNGYAAYSTPQTASIAFSADS
jgi:hypothetical protein